MSDEEYTKWKKKHGDKPLEPWIQKILDHPNPTKEFCIKAYNEKEKSRSDEG